MVECLKIRPQAGPQLQANCCTADIMIYGGSAGCGKSWLLLAEVLRCIRIPGFRGMIFRRTTPEITNPGGLWDESEEMYPHAGGVPTESKLLWEFPTGAELKMGHMEHWKDTKKYQGTAIAYMAFDELTHFDEKQFWYMVSRNRNPAGCNLSPYIRASCNPEADSWVADLIQWWIDPETGFPIAERSGVLRWFYRVEGEIQWYDSKQKAIDNNPEQQDKPKSFTFIAGTIDDNPALLERDPGYRANLNSLHEVERQRLLKGNWKAMPEGDSWWPFEYFQNIFSNACPSGLKIKIAANDPSLGKKDGDYNATVSVASNLENGHLHAESFMVRKPQEEACAEIAAWCRSMIRPPDILFVEDPGFRKNSKDAGDYSAYMATMKKAFNAAGLHTVVRAMGHGGVEKTIRIKRLDSLLRDRDVSIVDSDHSRLLVSQLKQFPNGKHDDGPDALEMAVRQFKETLAELGR